MKTIRYILAAVLGILAMAMPVAAQDYFTYTGTAQGGTNSYVIVEEKQGVPCVFFVDATVFAIADYTNASLAFWTGAAEQNVTRAGVTGTNTIYVAATNGWVVGDVLILSRVKETLFGRHTVASLTSSNLTITGTTLGPTVAGDKIYRMTVAARVKPTGASLRLLPADQPYFSGIAGRPSLIELQGTQTNTLNAVSGRWLPTTLGK